ncbi:LCP family protein [Kitasatospora cheerisanensis]|uniref:Putative lytR family regulatory protein n=1 Tax=Kitasatospora cheerisanensis KCTC 2395 TaxID=1348663 RepID=A0A066YTX3_9ACTN|nr:LCP family protein [Kitasatospora cheerisanensis]KDN85003.1 putative lytR family regulatory protein [Kitasatospora cheerisanensis KCTC 2395]
MTAEERPDEADQDRADRADRGEAGQDGADRGPLSIFDRDDEQDPSGEHEDEDEADAAPRRRRGRRLLLWTLAVLLVLFGGGFGALVWTAEHYASSVERIPNAFPTVPASAQPTAVPHSGQTFLLVGLDARADRATTGQDAKAPAWQVGAQRSDTMMLMHISADRKSVSVVSIPRDTWVPVPGHGKAKINAAYSWGGPALMVQTVQDLTHIRIDHLAVIDWNGFRALTDAVGGVDITVPRTIEAKGDAREWTAGTHHMDGAEALLYVRERHGLPNGDLDRTKRQQNFLRALMLRTMNSGTLSSPAKLTGLLGTVGDVVSVDDRLSNSDLYDLAWSLRAVRPDGVHFMNAPFGGFDTVDGQSVVLMDDGAAGVLWDAIRTDRMDDYLAQHRTSADTLGDNVS